MARSGGKARQRERKRKQAAVAAQPSLHEVGKRLDKAFRQIDAGDLSDAARRLAGLVRQVPRHAETRHALGYVLHLQGRDEDAVKELSRAVEFESRNPACRNSLAIVLHKLGRLDEAIEQGRAAVDMEPGNPAFQFNLGNALKDSGGFEEAVSCYRKALAAHPDDPEILNNLGIALTQCEASADEAVDLFRRALLLRPDDPQIPYNLGLAHQVLGDHAKAFEGFRASLVLDEAYDPAIAAIAALHVTREEMPKAIATYRHYLALRPDDHVAMRALAELLRAAGKFTEARQWVDRLALLTPDDPCVARVLAGILVEQDDVDGAVAELRKVVAADPGGAEAWLDLGRIHILREEFQEAARCLDGAAAADPESARLFHLKSLIAEAEGDLDTAGRMQDECLARSDNFMMRAHRGRLHLTAGEFGPGFALNEARLEEKGNAVDDLPAPLWEGQSLAGKRLLIAAEQGVGDEIIFGSCIPDVLEQADACAIECDPRMVSLFRRSFPGALVHPSQKSVDNLFNIRSYSWIAPDQKPDYAIPIGSLARWCRPTIESFPDRGGYMKVDPERVAHWRRRLEALGPGLKVGLCWRSSLGGLERSRFYSKVDDWAPLLTAPGVVPVNLQYDDCQAELAHAREAYGVDIHAMPDLDLYNDFENMAAMMRALDVVVSVSTIMPYLAAATGQRVLGVSIGRDWSLLGTDRYPWLPELTPLIRKPGEDWSVVISDITRRIGAMVAEEKSARAA